MSLETFAFFSLFTIYLWMKLNTCFFVADDVKKALSEVCVRMTNIIQINLLRLKYIICSYFYKYGLFEFQLIKSFLFGNNNENRVF